ncbi:phosphatase PAP2 family protein [Kitasatospora sp. NPDC001540]|uniref:phosphatase PAP2 family protein n=1 Tax=Kitasatospora sp. NPDC001540 TaxID=3364014 RepID=UPI0036B69AA3
MNPLAEADLTAVRRAASWHRRPLRRILLAGQEAADHGTLWWATAALAAATTGRPGRRRWAVEALAAMLTAQLLSNGIAKHLVHRRRPPARLLRPEDVHARPGSSSFPSGHAAAAAAFAAATLRHSLPWGAAASAAALTVATARVHTGAHYPSDVAAGGALGVAAAALTHRTLWRRLRP